MAGIFGRPSSGAFPAWQYDPTMDSPANGGIAGNMRIDTSVPADPYEGQRPQVGGFFGRLGQNLKGIDWATTLAGGLADGVATHFGAQPGFVPAIQEQQRQKADIEKATLLDKLRADREARDQQAINMGNGGVATWSQDGGLNVLREPTPTVHKTPLQEQIEYVRTLNPGMTDAQAADLAQHNMSGFRYTPEGIAAQGQIATNRAAAGARYRAPRVGGGGGVTPTARANAIAQAEAAIARGADRSAVYARLAKMGIQ